MIVHINGMPGVGKLTVAKRLCELMPARLIDNHLVIDLVHSVCGRGTPGYGPMITAITEVVYRFIGQLPAGEVIVFTNALAKEIPLDLERLATIQSLARRMNTPFVPIVLTCDGAENERRLVLPERSAKGKLREVHILQDLSSRFTIAHDPAHPNALEIDTTGLSPNEAATRIAEHLKRCIAVEA